MTLKEQLVKVLRSRKFWVLVIALLTAAGGYCTGDLGIWELLKVVVASLAVYSTGVALEDAGLKMGQTGKGQDGK
jgi:hypothetical protein